MIEIPAVNVADETPAPPRSTSRIGVRRPTRQVNVGGIKVGGGAPISVQTMTKTKTGDVRATVQQIIGAAEAGCDIVRVTVNDKEAAEAIREIVRQSPIPVVADIHFNHVFALKSVEASVAKVRLNPGNIGNRDRIHQVLSAAKAGIPSTAKGSTPITNMALRAPASARTGSPVSAMRNTQLALNSAGMVNTMRMPVSRKNDSSSGNPSSSGASCTV